MAEINVKDAWRDAITTLSFEEALKELDSIVKKLESGKEPLESAIENYERGNALREHCESKLKEARLRIEQITVNADGSVSTAPLADAV